MVEGPNKSRNCPYEIFKFFRPSNSSVSGIDALAAEAEMGRAARDAK